MRSVEVLIFLQLHIATLILGDQIGTMKPYQVSSLIENKN